MSEFPILRKFLLYTWVLLFLKNKKAYPFLIAAATEVVNVPKNALTFVPQFNTPLIITSKMRLFLEAIPFRRKSSLIFLICLSMSIKTSIRDCSVSIYHSMLHSSPGNLLPQEAASRSDISNDTVALKVKVAFMEIINRHVERKSLKLPCDS